MRDSSDARSAEAVFPACRTSCNARSKQVAYAVLVSRILQITSRYLLISVSALSAVMKIGTFSISVLMQLVI
jgi:hypothetical protein